MTRSIFKPPAARRARYSDSVRSPVSKTSGEIDESEEHDSERTVLGIEVARERWFREVVAEK
jgi:hypothetical protein